MSTKNLSNKKTIANQNVVSFDCVFHCDSIFAENHLKDHLINLLTPFEEGVHTGETCLNELKNEQDLAVITTIIVDSIFSLIEFPLSWSSIDDTKARLSGFINVLATKITLWQPKEISLKETIDQDTPQVKIYGEADL